MLWCSWIRHHIVWYKTTKWCVHGKVKYILYIAFQPISTKHTTSSGWSGKNLVIWFTFHFHLLIWIHSYSTLSAKKFLSAVSTPHISHLWGREEKEYHTADMGKQVEVSSFCSVISIGLWASNVTVVLNSDRIRILLRELEKMVENTPSLGRLRRGLKNK